MTTQDFFDAGFSEKSVTDRISALATTDAEGVEEAATTIMFVKFAIAVERLEKDNEQLKKQITVLQYRLGGTFR